MAASVPKGYRTLVAIKSQTSLFWRVSRGHRSPVFTVCKGCYSTEADNYTRGVIVSKAMASYMKKLQDYDKLMSKEIEEFETGKRHLANIMGRDPEHFTQSDINEAIAYLLPSGLFDKKARPMMKHPKEIYPAEKAAEFDALGRPHHYLFYTNKPQYYEIMHKASKALGYLNSKEVQLKEPVPVEGLQSTEWISHKELVDRCSCIVNEHEYQHYIRLMDLLANNNQASLILDFILSQRKPRDLGQISDIPEIQIEDGTGRKFSKAEGYRKRTKATATLFWEGSGKVSINGKNIMYFKEIQTRSQVMFPLQFAGCLGEVDIEVKVNREDLTDGEGFTTQAGAIRLALSRALVPFVDENMRERMRIAGLLTKNIRVAERQKVGQRGARRKKHWRKR